MIDGDITLMARPKRVTVADDNGAGASALARCALG
jgi:hypothetical protein